MSKTNTSNYTTFYYNFPQESAKLVILDKLNINKQNLFLGEVLQRVISSDVVQSHNGSSPTEFCTVFYPLVYVSKQV